MSDGFLGRWSRLKRAVPVAPAVALPAAPEALEVELPAMETLGAASDYTAFLKTGVSAAIQQQALRRAWESDVSIASFRGMADYDWDFNAPAYGRLWATDDVARLLRNVLAPPPPEPAPEPEPEPPVVEAQLVSPRHPNVVPEVADPVRSDPTPLPHRHGSALPC